MCFVYTVADEPVSCSCYWSDTFRPVDEIPEGGGVTYIRASTNGQTHRHTHTRAHIHTHTHLKILGGRRELLRLRLQGRRQRFGVPQTLHRVAASLISP